MTRDSETIRVWDLPVRITHWCFVLLLPAMWWTAENSEMAWHKRLGLLLLALLVFRLMWGLVGSSTARFASFVKSPSTVFAYFRGTNRSTSPGHNPAGGWSVVALLLVMSVQVSTGLFAGDPYDGATGPLNDLVRTMTADTLTDIHETNFNIILALVALHLLAVAYYTFIKRAGIVGPMVSGRGMGQAGGMAMEPVPAWRAAVCLGIGLGVSAWVWNGAPPL